MTMEKSHRNTQQSRSPNARTSILSDLAKLISELEDLQAQIRERTDGASTACQIEASQQVLLTASELLRTAQPRASQVSSSREPGRLKRNAVPSRAPAKAKVVTPPPMKQLKSCPVCHVLVKETKLASHIQKVHPQVRLGSVSPIRNVSRTKPSKSISGRDIRSAGFFVCPHCDCKVPSSAIDQHLVQAHNYRASVFHERQSKNEAQKQRNQKPPRVTSRAGRGQPRNPSFSQTETYYEPDPLDGGKELGMSRRENGRFGSLSMYDSHDEESAP
jgi:hypothetical protein